MFRLVGAGSGLLRNACLASRVRLNPNVCQRVQASSALQGKPMGSLFSRSFSSEVPLENLRNFGVSAHIDSGKTTLTERILYYTGRIKAIHEVRGKDGVGAKMDSMELERERGITIQSAATFTSWKKCHLNIIDTPGHVDFTIEVERALRVLDGAILVMCAVAGAQSQTVTVDRQMRRYDVPRVTFINKMDRGGANPWKALGDLQEKLKHNAELIQLPIGTVDSFDGVVDLIEQEALYFDGANGEIVRREPIPEHMLEDVKDRREILVGSLADVDDELGEKFLMEEDITVADIKGAIRRATIALKFTPVLMGTAFKNKGVQPLLDAVVDYLPNPTEVTNYALDLTKDEEKFELAIEPEKSLVCLAFKLEEGRFGQLTYVRVYQGTVRKGQTLLDPVNNKKIRVPRLVRMHSNEMEDVPEIRAGEIGAMFGVECDSGTTFTDGKIKCSMTSMFVPEPVISLSIKPKEQRENAKYSKALARFCREDPTFRLHTDPETNEGIISGMGELHLQIYVERMKREYGVDTIVGQPKVHYRETLSSLTPFNYQHKKQSGGRGQYGRLIGHIEPLEDPAAKFEFENQLVGSAIPPEFHPGIEKGFYEAAAAGAISGHPVCGVKVILTDGDSHPVDSSELAFRICAAYAFRQAFTNGPASILEPIMSVEVECPIDFQGDVVGGLNRKKGMIEETYNRDTDAVIRAAVPLSQMFGYSTELRSITEGMGQFSMEYKTHAPVTRDEMNTIVKHWEATRGQEED